MGRGDRVSARGDGGGDSAEFPSRPEKARPGDLLFGTYRLVRKLGDGGLGTVWLVRHISFDDERVLKLFRSPTPFRAEARERFGHDARRINRLAHPNVVRINDAKIGEASGGVETDYVDGITLQDLLGKHRGEPVPPATAAAIAGPLVDALRAMHGAGVDHMNLKPRKVLLADAVSVRVRDFGLARLCEDGDGRLPVTTPGYSAPEMFGDGRPDPRADVFSAGVVLYEMLTGYPPFVAPKPSLIVEKYRAGPPPFARRNPEARWPAELEAAVIACLFPRPEERPTAGELAERLRAAWPSGARGTVVSPGGGTAGPGDLTPPEGYRLVERLGVGGFGQVWRAAGPGGVHVALKFVRLGDEAESREAGALEFLKAIRHPNLMVPFGAWREGEHLVLGMELAEGTLWERFKAAKGAGREGLDRAELIGHLREAARGLDFLNEGEHERGDGTRGAIYHCDVKPQNLLLLGGGVKVADFGLARFTSHSQTKHSGGLTVAYAAPEFLDGRSARQSDQYSLAVTYCQLRGGRLPFEGETPQVVGGHLRRRPDLGMLPQAERAVVARALEKDPRRRWPTCRAFVEALAAVAVDDVAAGATRPGIWARLRAAWSRAIGPRTPEAAPTEDRAGLSDRPEAARTTEPRRGTGEG